VHKAQNLFTRNKTCQRKIIAFFAAALVLKQKKLINVVTRILMSVTVWIRKNRSTCKRWNRQASKSLRFRIPF